MSFTSELLVQMGADLLFSDDVCIGNLQETQEKSVLTGMIHTFTLKMFTASEIHSMSVLWSQF